MEEKNGFWDYVRKTIPYILVAALASMITLFVFGSSQSQKLGKLRELNKIIDTMYIGEVDQKNMEDYAASAMVAALGDQWSFYVPAQQYQSYQEQHANAYVGIGVTGRTCQGWRHFTRGCDRSGGRQACYPDRCGRGAEYD